MTQQLLTTNQLATQLGVSRGAVHLWATSTPPRLVPVTTTPGGHRRWDFDDTVRQLTALRVDRAPRPGADRRARRLSCVVRRRPR